MKKKYKSKKAPVQGRTVPSSKITNPSSREVGEKIGEYGDGEYGEEYGDALNLLTF